jgi:hypothetical protein
MENSGKIQKAAKSHQKTYKYRELASKHKPDTTHQAAEGSTNVVRGGGRLQAHKEIAGIICTLGPAQSTLCSEHNLGKNRNT